MIDIICGARPNFMKMDPLLRNLDSSLEPRVIHTGQHYDHSMSQSFFEELELPRPDINLGVGSASITIQTARIMKKYEEVVLKDPPSAVVVVGDVNSTLACSLVAVRYGIPVIHVEAGLRSFRPKNARGDQSGSHRPDHQPDADHQPGGQGQSPG